MEPCIARRAFSVNSEVQFRGGRDERGRSGRSRFDEAPPVSELDNYKGDVRDPQLQLQQQRGGEADEKPSRGRANHWEADGAAAPLPGPPPRREGPSHTGFIAWICGHDQYRFAAICYFRRCNNITAERMHI